MMDNQHRIIKGYRELSAEEIALMNEVKEAGAALQALCNKVETHISTQWQAAYDADLVPQEAELDRLAQANPYRWLERATDDLQTGIMKLVRSVAQPTTF
jgi:uncharacterized protein (DUF1697 family)